MKDLFVTKSVAYGVVGTVAGSWAITSLPDGSLVLLNPDGSNASTGTTGAVSAAFNGTYFNINCMTSDGNRQSIKIERSGFAYTKKAYTAPVKAVKFLGTTIGTIPVGNLNLPSSLSTGDTVGVSIVDKSKPPNDTSAVKTYSFRVLAGDLLTGTTSRNIITKLVALINAKSTVVVASTTDDGTDNDGIKFVATTAGIDFNVARIDGVLYNSDIVEFNILNNVYNSNVTTTKTGAVANNTGNGTYAQLLKVEADGNTRSGNTHTQVLGKYMWSATSNLSSALNYTTYYCTFTPLRDSEIDRDSNYKQLIGIAVPTTATAMIADLDTLLAAATS